MPLSAVNKLLKRIQNHALVVTTFMDMATIPMTVCAAARIIMPLGRKEIKVSKKYTIWDVIKKFVNHLLFSKEDNDGNQNVL